MRSLRICLSNKLPGDATGPETRFGNLCSRRWQSYKMKSAWVPESPYGEKHPSVFNIWNLVLCTWNLRVYLLPLLEGHWKGRLKKMFSPCGNGWFAENESYWMGNKEPGLPTRTSTRSDPSGNSKMLSVDCGPDTNSHLQIPLHVKKWL